MSILGEIFLFFPKPEAKELVLIKHDRSMFVLSLICVFCFISYQVDYYYLHQMLLLEEKKEKRIVQQLKEMDQDNK